MAAAGGRPWLRSALWLMFLGPFFFITYNYANGLAARRAGVPTIAFAWESVVPFVPWTILPYWSSDLLYAIALPLSRTRRELDRLGLRLLAIQIFSIACFLAFPLKCTLTRPPISGWTGMLFDSLMTFDQPFNQAPSLHVSLAVILWHHYRKQLHGPRRLAMGAWFLLIALSAWTTYQHHFIDLPTGLWAGILITAAIPEHSFPQARYRKLAALYLTAAIALTVAAFLVQGVAWILCWPAFSLSMVAAAYWTGDTSWLGKHAGTMPAWIWPYTFAAWCNSRLWTRGKAPRNHLGDGVWIGRAPGRGEREDLRSIIDLTAELPLASTINIPILDLTVPSHEQLDEAVEALSRTVDSRPTLLCCALGYSRSAIAGAAWLLATRRAQTAQEAVAQVQAVRAEVRFGESVAPWLQQWADQRRSQ